MAYPHNSGSVLGIFLKFCTMKGANSWMKININGSYQKIFRGKWAILGMKMAHSHNSGSAVRIVLQFCTIKGTKRYMKILLVVF